MKEKKIELQPQKSHNFWWYVVGVLLIPLLAGIYLLYKKVKELSEIHYKITDKTITSVSSSFTESVDIANINDVKIDQRWIDKQFGIGNLQLITNTRKVDLIGLENPKNMADLIMKAAEAERYKIEQQQKKERVETKSSPGSLDKLDYLTGLWQQGLISNDDYLREKKHFEE
ncbi:hypothetical protein [Rhodohalobacter sulfatireducens]|uniref:PH domain-containing protein n=1 Tax=Rhodohalobacter sulfatireducens TaxID=2911366 RepID=A0ABS9KFR5_9BACT|nr:hypothetical protein [Rhodohalobacter sulfatireducens]MCG2589650.1 hypothetical protein [Rhodohalobacter sulfatireducens]